MPRNVSGVYVKPPNTTAVSGEVIESVAYNRLADDLASDNNLPRPISAGGTGGTSPSSARSALSVYSKAETDNFNNLPRPISAGGTGGTSPSTARTALDVYSKAEAEALNVASATKLETPRTIGATAGPVRFTPANFDGTANIAYTTTIPDGALTIAKTSGLQGALDGKLDRSGGTVSGNLTVGGTATLNGNVSLPDRQFGWQSETPLYGMDARNSDIIGLNALVFNDAADSVAEGIFFPRDNGLAGLPGHSGLRAESDSLLFGADASGTWEVVYHGGNFDPDSKLNRSGGTLTGNLNGTTAGFSSEVEALRFRATSSRNLSLTSTAHGFQVGADNSLNIGMDNNEIMARNNGAPSALAINRGGGDVQLAGAVTCADDGDITCRNVTTTSDERMKRNIRPVQTDALRHLRIVAFEWEKTGDATIGVIAQQVREYCPEAVKVADDGSLSVNYALLALVAVAEARDDFQRQIEQLRDDAGLS